VICLQVCIFSWNTFPSLIPTSRLERNSLITTQFIRSLLLRYNRFRLYSVVRFNILTTVSTKTVVFWFVTPDSLVTSKPLHGAPHNKVPIFESYDMGISIWKKNIKSNKTNYTKYRKSAIRKKVFFFTSMCYFGVKFILYIIQFHHIRFC